MAIRPIGTSYPQEGAAVVPANNGKVVTAATNDGVVRNIFVSTADPSGGMDGDVWIKYV